MSGDVAKSESDGADEVLGDSWPTDSESAANDASKEQLRQAGLMEEAARNAGQGRDYAMQEMEGEAAEGIATKFGIHVGEFNDRMLQHQYTAGWLALLAGAISTAKTAMNAAVASHESIHSAPTAFWTFLGEPIGADSVTQEAKDESLNAAKAAVQEAAQTLETTKSNIALAISSGQKPPLVPQLPTDAAPPPTTRDVDSGGGAPSDFPSANPSAVPAPGASAPGSASGGPATAPAASAPAAPMSGGGAPSMPPPTLGGDMGAPAPSASSPLGGDTAGAGSPMGGSPMGGMPMGGMPQMTPPQMPQMPTQTPGNDLAKTVGDTVGKLAGGQNGQPVDAATLDKLIAANGEGSGGLGDDHGVKKDGEKGPEGARTETAGATTGTGSGSGGGSAPSSPYSAANMNPALNNPAPVAGPPSPAAPTVTAAPPSVAAPVTELSGDESAANRAYPVAHTGADVGAGAATHTSAAQNGNAYGPGQNGQQPGQAASPMMGGGGALGAYPPGGAGFAPMPPPVAGGAPMASGMGAPAAVPAAAVTAAGAAAAPMIVPAAAASSSSLSADAAAGLNSGPERIAVLPPEHAVAHEHLAGVVKAFRDCPSMAWTTVRVAIGVFLHEEPGLPSRRVRYILATTDGLSLIPMDVKLPAGVELLSGLVDASGSFASDWNGNERPALKLVAAADFYPDVLGRLDYLLSNDTTDGIVAPAKAADVAEVVQSKTQTDALIATGKASQPALSRVMVDSPLIPPQKAADALEAFGKAWKFNDGTPDDLKEATTRLWATRWGAGNRRLERPDDYSAILATYFYVEGMDALGQGRLDDAAYSAYALARINP